MADPRDPLLHALVEAVTDSWNRHDAKSLAAAFAPDGELVNWRGRRFAGRDAVERFFTFAFKSSFAESRVALGDVHARYPAQDVGSVDAIWTMSGARGGESGVRPDHRVLLDLTAVRNPTGGVWIFAAHLRDLPPETPNPSAGGSAPPSPSG